MMRFNLNLKAGLQRPRAWFGALMGLGLVLPMGGCSDAGGTSGVPLVVVTTGQIHDATRALVEGVEVELKLLCGPGVDPHSYGASTGDVLAMDRAKLIVFNGFHLEAQLAELLEREAIAEKAWSMAGAFPAERRLSWSEDGVETDGFDPHIWNDLRGWSVSVEALSTELAELFPAEAQRIAANSERYVTEVTEMDAWAREELARLPESRRVLVSGHDAFSYFARNYGLETVAILGVGNDPEADLKSMRLVAEQVVAKKVPAVFLESVTNPRLTQALIEACEARGWSTRIADDPLYSDDLGVEAPVDTFLGAFRANVMAISSALGES
ncbi:MAG: zinc ABC transporter substrate-binding protein [Planctomycetota bacterium]|nr:zinc ABC transporter substrate-binding protein [Planctomycetota bacterium]MDG1984320.1 zinc ABC transporter substrate-binding protein [Planctomycetota bacterium]